MPILPGHHTQNIENKAKRAASGLGLSTRLALAMVSLVVVTTVVLSFITYRSVTEAGIPRALDRLATKARLSASRLEAAVNSARQDMLMVQAGIGVAQLIDGRTAVPFAADSDARIRESIAARFLAILSAKPEYAQLRIIGLADGGRELVRVDRGGPGSAVRIVPDAELMQVGERDYFKARSASRGPTFTYRLSSFKSKRMALPTAPQCRCFISQYRCGRPPDSRSESACSISIWDRSSMVFAPKKTARILSSSQTARANICSIPSPAVNSHSSRGRRRVQDDFPEFDEAVAGGGSGSGIWTDRNGARFRGGLGGGAPRGRARNDDPDGRQIFGPPCRPGGGQQFGGCGGPVCGSAGCPACRRFCPIAIQTAGANDPRG